MKCKSCKMRMSDFFITFDYENNGITKKAMNVPAYKCPSCNKVIVPDLILGKLEAFAEWEKVILSTIQNVSKWKLKYLRLCTTY